ncbi:MULTISPECIES: FecR family protein [Niastella]|uniref:FecR family protein n=1 Tax=Niastella soli TaxID=2821487 RepID=A0ABS3Z1F1_9BACT|nr:FecR domain-containing protein [Niastella soli]MBO9203975.1 FecR family protein [Niastella soli]
MNEQQIEKATYIASLILGNMQDKLTPTEQQELETWLQENGDNNKLYEDMLDQEKLGNDLNELSSYDHQAAYEKLSQQLFITEQTGKRLYFRIWWYMVAALVILVAGGVAYFALNKPQIPAARSVVIAQKKAPGIAPDSKKAVLILGDGSTVALSEMNNGDVAQQGNVVVKKIRNGLLEYKLTGEPSNATVFNTIRTPRGGEYEVILEDGSHIWLNSASTLQFPIHFNNPDRRVALSGEGYFEVESSLLPSGRKKTFTVSVDNMEVQAVGTAFNISAYKEDDRSLTTVVEGLVKVNRNNKTNMLSPGKKLIAKDSNVTVEEADIKQEIAWKNGDFVFRNTSLNMVMNELARWYDMDVAYDKGVPSLHFSGEVQRASDIWTVLQMLEYTGGVRFTISNRIVTVHPGKK